MMNVLLLYYYDVMHIIKSSNEVIEYTVIHDYHTYIIIQRIITIRFVLVVE